MKINLRVRFRNPQFWFQVILSATAPALAYAGIVTEDLTSWSILFETMVQAFKNPYVLGMTAVALYNSLNDPTTDGLSDSKQAMRYERPKKG